MTDTVSAEQERREADLLVRVVRSLDDCPDPRLKQLMTALVHHLQRTLVTHIFVRGDQLLDTDTVFGVKQSLVKHFERQPPGSPTPDGHPVDGAWSRVAFDIVLAPAARPG
jgi:hypothetical protein